MDKYTLISGATVTHGHVAAVRLAVSGMLQIVTIRQTEHLTAAYADQPLLLAAD